MSEETPKITTVKREETPKITTVKREKDPKRVEAGKRLAAISKQARENKMRERIESENKQRDDSESWNINYGFLFGLVGVASAISTLYYMRRGDTRQIIKEELEVKHIKKDMPNSNCNTLDCL